MNLIEVSSIQIAPNRHRKSFDPGRLNELQESIQAEGLFHAIVLRFEGGVPILVAGERRLRAVSQLYDLGGSFSYDGVGVASGLIPFTKLEDLDALARELAELGENIKRDDLTWQERAAALERIAQLRAERGEASSPAVMAEEFFEPAREGLEGSTGYATEAVRQQLAVARHLDDPDVQKAKSAGEAYKVLKRKESHKRDERLAAKVGATHSSASHTVLNADSLEWLETAPAGKFQIILTDPPYGMGADEFGDSGGKTAGEHLYEDSPEVYWNVLSVCEEHLYRVAAEQAHLYWFCDIDKFPSTRGAFEQAGWWVHRTPLVWFRPGAYRIPWSNASGTFGPQRKYELVLYAVKGKRQVNMVRGDVLQHNPDVNLGHQAQKPVALFRDLLERSAKPGDQVLDPFAGSGTILPAAHGLKLSATAIERDAGSYGIALRRLEGLK